MEVLRRHRVLVISFAVPLLGCVVLGWLLWAASVRSDVSVAVSRAFCEGQDTLPLTTTSYPDLQDAVVPVSPTFGIALTGSEQTCHAAVAVRNDSGHDVLVSEILFPQLGDDGEVGRITTQDTETVDGDAVVPVGTLLSPGESTEVAIDLTALPSDRPADAGGISTFHPGAPKARVRSLGTTGTVISPIELTFVSGL